MDLPHDAHVVAADLLEGEAPRDHLNESVMVKKWIRGCVKLADYLPQDDPPREDVALLSVRRACKQ